MREVKDSAAQHPDVSVVVPYFDDQQGLDRLLAALELQTLPSGRFEVVVADDGSPEPPHIGSRPYRVLTTWQPDEGFRAAAARNLGARSAGGRLLAFLDGDMVPEPGYLAALVDADAASTDAKTLLVGRRRHADLGGWTAADVTSWLRGEGTPPEPLPDPQWLLDGYAATGDLVDADDRSYRFVISAVLAVPREDFISLGGFASFTGYGGEDWEFAHRWRHAGGAFRHLPDAIAWQDGADFGGRHDPVTRQAIKDAEAARLAPLIAVPGARDPRLIWAIPRIAAIVDAHGLSPAQTLECVASLLDGGEVGVWVDGLPDVLAEHLEDPRIHRLGDGRPEDSTHVVTVHRPGVLTGTTLAELVGSTVANSSESPERGDDEPPVMTALHVPTSTRWPLALSRGAWQPLPASSVTLEELWSRRG